jgi:hypothetical protein
VRPPRVVHPLDHGVILRVVDHGDPRAGPSNAANVRCPFGEVHWCPAIVPVPPIVTTRPALPSEPARAAPWSAAGPG